MYDSSYNIQVSQLLILDKNIKKLPPGCNSASLGVPSPLQPRRSRINRRRRSNRALREALRLRRPVFDHFREGIKPVFL